LTIDYLLFIIESPYAELIIELPRHLCRGSN